MSEKEFDALKKELMETKLRKKNLELDLAETGKELEKYKTYFYGTLISTILMAGYIFFQ
jgi:predicted  nucleic acid-binding Zn-ribbon protein